MSAEIRAVADKNYALFKDNPKYPSLNFKKVGSLWSVRVGQHYRALGYEEQDGVNWFWIGCHAEYDRLIG
jgi:hypothetical protein